ncbi:MAG: hypothetical protein M1830_010545 [Pleopsidium flavum]|nr:MAG: hypothetical protein M1830_010545 [Pleopsidium flavum]
MPQLQLRTPQFHLPARTAPQWRQTLRLHSKTTIPTTQPNPRSPSPSPQRTSAPQLSLLEELFPETSKPPSPTSTPPSRNRHSPDDPIPPLPLSPDLSDTTSFPLPQPSQHGIPRRRSGRIGNSAEALQRKETTILILRNASRALDESDFKRIVPRGKHIEGWVGRGDFVKVIPIRDPVTMHAVGHYMLLFPSPASAHAYQEHLVHLHRTARTHTPRSVQSPIAPPPGYLVEGEDVYQLLQEYALVPASQRLSLKVLVPPYSTMVRSVVEKGGYGPVVDGEGEGRDKVLFWVDGFRPSMFLLREVIARDGRDRGLGWELGGGGITKLVEAPVAAAAAAAASGADVEGGGEDEGEGESSRQTRRVAGRWVIRFKDEAEARRFVRSWHRRPFPLHRDSAVYGEPPPLANAEFLW